MPLLVITILCAVIINATSYYTYTVIIITYYTLATLIDTMFILYWLHMPRFFTLLHYAIAFRRWYIAFQYTPCCHFRHTHCWWLADDFRFSLLAITSCHYVITLFLSLFLQNIIAITIAIAFITSHCHTCCHYCCHFHIDIAAAITPHFRHIINIRHCHNSWLSLPLLIDAYFLHAGHWYILSLIHYCRHCFSFSLFWYWLPLLIFQLLNTQLIDITLTLIQPDDARWYRYYMAYYYYTLLRHWPLLHICHCHYYHYIATLSLRRHWLFTHCHYDIAIEDATHINIHIADIVIIVAATFHWLLRFFRHYYHWLPLLIFRHYDTH